MILCDRCNLGSSSPTLERILSGQVVNLPVRREGIVLLLLLKRREI